MGTVKQTLLVLTVEKVNEGKVYFVQTVGPGDEFLVDTARHHFHLLLADKSGQDEWRSQIGKRYTMTLEEVTP